MSFFTTRELGKSAEKIRAEGKVRELVRSEFAPRRRRPDDDLTGQVGSAMQKRPADNHFAGHVGSVMQHRPADNHFAGHVDSVMQQMASSPLQEIDDLIVVLQRRREKLLNESARVHRAVIEYAKLSQSTMQSARIITESLSHLNKVPAPPHKSERHVGDVSNEEHCDSGGAAFAQHDMGDQAEVTAVPASSDVSDLPEEASGPGICRDGDTDETGLSSPGDQAGDRQSLAANHAVPAHVDSA